MRLNMDPIRFKDYDDIIMEQEAGGITDSVNRYEIANTGNVHCIFHSRHIIKNGRKMTKTRTVLVLSSKITCPSMSA